MSNVKETLEAVQGIVEAVPVYEDLIQPASKELSKGMLTLAKTVNMALAPLSAMVWGYEKIRDNLIPSLKEKLKNVPEENIITPQPEIAVPAIEALRYTGHNEELREMFSNLLANAMDISTESNAHPAFVEIIKQISSDEAKIIKSLANNPHIPIIRVRLFELNGNTNRFAEPLTNFSYLSYQIQCAHPELGPSYFVNMVRLGLANISYEVYDVSPNAYDQVENHPAVKEWKDKAPGINKRFEIQRGTISISPFGIKFIESCVLSK